MAFSLSYCLFAVAAVAMGWLTDKFGPRFVVMVLGSCLGVSYLLLSQFQALWQFYLFCGIIAGIGGSTIAVPIMATISGWHVRRRGTMTGVVQAGNGVGGLVAGTLSMAESGGSVIGSYMAGYLDLY